MSAPVKKRLTEARITIVGPKNKLNQVLKLVEKCEFSPLSDDSLDWRFVFEREIKKYTQPGAALRGARIREGMSQVALAKKIRSTQGAVSAMEAGVRPIGKEIAKRLSKALNTDYRTLL
jgi:DNA-binding XRE family transcriptional regulator